MIDKSEQRNKLRDSVDHYDDPTEPVGEDDWDAMKETDDFERDQPEEQRHRDNSTGIPHRECCGSLSHPG